MAVQHRVKLYKLNDTGSWDDKGTGLASIQAIANADGAPGLVVVAEDYPTDPPILVHKLVVDDIYTRQGGDTPDDPDNSIITWCDPDVGTDFALSFQDGGGCNAIWQQIVSVQRDPTQPLPQEALSRRRLIDEFDNVTPGEYREEEPGDGGAPDGDQPAPPPVELPAPELRNLEQIGELLSRVPPFQREHVGTQLLSNGYLEALLRIFRQCEDLEDTSSLAQMYKVIRNAIMLNDTAVLESLMQEEHVMDVVGCLEYDPEYLQQQAAASGAGAGLATDAAAAATGEAASTSASGGSQDRQPHRRFLQERVVFKEAVPITNPEVLAKIHQTYRIQYIKDVVLPRTLDDATYSSMASMALFNSVDVVVALHQDPDFFPTLFKRLSQHSPEDASWHDLVGFLQELCLLAKHLQPGTRQALYSKLISLGLFEVVTKVMQSGNQAVKLQAADVLLSALQHDPMPLRVFLARQEDQGLMRACVSELVRDTEAGLPEQVAELLKMLLDPETMDPTIEKNEFLELFYDNYIDQLVGAVASATEQLQGNNGAGPPHPPPPSAATLGIIVELLSYCVQHHSYRIKYYILRNHVVDKVLRLVRSRERWLAVAAVRFLRVCVGLKDEFYNRYLIRNNLLEPIISAFVENGDRYNLLNSAVLELVDFVRKENVKGLLVHLVEQYGHMFDEVTYVDTFKQLRLKFDQRQEGGANGRGDDVRGPSSPDRGGLAGKDLGRRRRRDERELDQDEEDYFSEDEPRASLAEHSGGSNAASAGAMPQYTRGASPPFKRMPLSPPQHSAPSAQPKPHGLGPSSSPDSNGGGGGHRPTPSAVPSTAWLACLAAYDDDDDDDGAAPVDAPNTSLPSNGPSRGASNGPAVFVGPPSTDSSVLPVADGPIWPVVQGPSLPQPPQPAGDSNSVKPAGQQQLQPTELPDSPMPPAAPRLWHS